MACIVFVFELSHRLRLHHSSLNSLIINQSMMTMCWQIFCINRQKGSKPSLSADVCTIKIFAEFNLATSQLHGLLLFTNFDFLSSII